MDIDSPDNTTVFKHLFNYENGSFGNYYYLQNISVIEFEK